MDAQSLAKAEDGGLLDAVPSADLTDRCVVLDSECSEGVPGFDSMIFLGGLFGCLSFCLLVFLLFSKKDFFLLVL